MPITATRWTTAAAAVTLLAAFAGTAAVASASTPTWKTAATIHGVTFSDVAATGPNDAWAVGYSRLTKVWNPRVRHWDGHGWKAMPLPASVNGVALQNVSASSSKNVWVGGNTLAGTPYLLHWDGKRWQVSAGKGSANFPVVLTLGAKDTWTFTWRAGYAGTSDTRHFNGRSWSAVKMPGVISSVSAVSARDIWAAGSKNVLTNGMPAIMHWDGKAWNFMASPAVANGNTTFTSIFARTRTDVWVVGHSFQPIHPNQDLPLAFHWNGKSWTDLVPPAEAGPLWSVTDDAAGGVWAIGKFNRLYHYAAGKWTYADPPAHPGYYWEIDRLARIPRTALLWGIGSVYDNKSVEDGLIIKYGN